VHRDVGLVAPLREYIDELIHPSALVDTVMASRHRAFIAPRLIGSLVGLAALPVYVTLRGAPSLLEFLVLGWLVVPILLALFLSRTGQYEGAHVLSSLAFAGLVTAVAMMTGGITSFSASWLVLVPLEAALSASRRVVVMASIIALVAAGILLFGHSDHLFATAPLGDHEQATLAAFGIMAATLYATGVALGAESLARTSFWKSYAEEDRYRVLAHDMSDVIARHGERGTTRFLSPTAEKLFGVPLRELRGAGLFERIHVADRPAYLTCIADAARHGQAAPVEFRARRGRGDAAAPTEFLWIEMRCRSLDPTVPAAGTRRSADVIAVLPRAAFSPP
jgi:cell cycle sensor histidine kinase DivJ